MIKFNGVVDILLWIFTNADMIVNLWVLNAFRFATTIRTRLRKMFKKVRNVAMKLSLMLNRYLGQNEYRCLMNCQSFSSEKTSRKKKRPARRAALHTDDKNGPKWSHMIDAILTVKQCTMLIMQTWDKSWFVRICRCWMNHWFDTRKQHSLGLERQKSRWCWSSGGWLGWCPRFGDPQKGQLSCWQWSFWNSFVLEL